MPDSGTSGIVNKLIWVFSYCYLKITRRFTRRRLDSYDFWSNQPEKTGFIIPTVEWNLESPQGDDDVQKNTDVVFCNGVNSSSEGLFIRMCRQGNGRVQISLVLRLANGRTYSMPPEHSLQAETDEPYTFGCSRVKMQCLLPMRRWRVFFNGMLRETSNDPEDHVERYRHVKFTFIWTASSGVYDYKYHASPKVQADVAARFWTRECPPLQLLRRMKRMDNNYEQCGMLLGTVSIEDQPEKEVYLWGLRGRYMGPKDEQERYDSFDAFINAENGTFIRLRILNTKGHIEDVLCGCVMRPIGFMLPIENVTFLKKKEGIHHDTHFICAVDGEKFTVKLSEENLKSNFDGKFNAYTSINQFEGCVNSMPARGFILETNMKIEGEPGEQPTTHQNVETKHASMPDSINPLSLPFDNSLCQATSVSGGKGSSLSKLTCISEELKSFTVPKGIVVTTTAYSTFTQNFLPVLMKQLQNVVWVQEQDMTAVRSVCESVMKEIINANLPSHVKESIEKNLNEVFGEDINNIRFAVRSSATGEDTELMSAAGQMETFLGCKGVSEVQKAVKKCWASQFSFVAIEYKRRYGQPLDTPMAVVIQEMVPCEAAGVGFSCDPVTGNPSYVSITANYGLGESVVSASAEPDTIILNRDMKDKLSIHSKATGVKQTKIIMDEYGGTKEVRLDHDVSSEYSISEETALGLGDVIIKIEKQFGTPTDVEWGVLDGNIFLLQARPVTTIDTITDFETAHTLDSYLRREDEFLTKGNFGEILPGATSPLGKDFLEKITELTLMRPKYTNLAGDGILAVPYYSKVLVHSSNHLFLSLCNVVMNPSKSDDEDIPDFIKATSVAFYGRVIKDKKIYQVARDRLASVKTSPVTVTNILYMTLFMFFAKYFIKNIRKKVEKYRIPIEDNSSSMEIFRSISENYQRFSAVFDVHTNCFLVSLIWNLGLLNLLGKASGDWDNNVYQDFAYLQSSVKHVESADVPASMQSLGTTISHSIEPERFKTMSVEEALQWLRTTTTEAGKSFKVFLEKHGHRGLKELDLAANTWAMDPRNLVKTLQEMVTKTTEGQTSTKSDSFPDIVSKMVTPLNFFQRLQLRFLLPKCHRGIRGREETKSLAVKSYGKLRHAFYQLADKMVSEGRLPNRDFLFFLCVEEIHQLIKTRSPTLVMKAFRRWKLQPELDKLIFPGISSGIPKPINMSEELDISGDGFSMTESKAGHRTRYKHHLAQYRRCIAQTRKKARLQFCQETMQKNTFGLPFKLAMGKAIAPLQLGLVHHEGTTARNSGEAISLILDYLFPNDTLPRNEAQALIVEQTGKDDGTSHNDEPDMTEQEIQQVLRKLPSGKAPGVPVSQGVVKGIARVVVNIADAHNIQHDDILITYSTDIAWSPYFPMLSGVVIEIGGLMSHGSVIAREYGLPCIVGTLGATRAFKSGDFVLLDGNRGILQKLEHL